MIKMKDSGIEWIGEIPQAWRTKRIKYLANGEENSFTDGDWIDSPYITDDGIRYLTTGNIGDGEYKNQGNGFISKETFETLKCIYAYPGDLVFSRLNSPYGRSCLLANDYPEYVIAVDNVILRTNEDKRFICYLTQCQGYQHVVEEKANGTTMKRISRTELGNVYLPIAPKQEQERISDYLDAKCVEIDTLIAAKEKTNALLKEQRQSLIYEAVTKGLNPTVPMKDSGIDWLGMIPEHWSVYRLKHILAKGKNAIKAGPFGSSLNSVEMQGSDVKVFNQRTVLDNDFEQGDEYVSFEKYDELKGFTAEGGDILITTRGTIGKTAIVPDGKFGILHPCLIKMKTNLSVFNRQLLCRLFNDIDLLTEQLRLASNATTIDVIYTQNLLNLYLPVPKIEEQQAILKYINENCDKIDKAIRSNEMGIEKLKEYRQSLIYEAVTGKIEI